MLSVGKQYETIEYFTKDPVHSLADGQWLGGAAAELGFSEMNADSIEKLQAGQNSKGEQVVELSKQGEHNPGKDLTFSIDKSFSILRYSAVTPQWLKDAHDAAMNKAAETVLKTAVDMGMITYRNTIDGAQVHTAIKDVNQLVAHIFLHSTSRENDPQSHGHIAIFNMAKVGDEFKAIKFDGIYTKDARAMLDQAARNAFIQEFQRAAGIDLKPYMAVDKKTGEVSLNIFDKETLEKYSTRSEQIKEYLQENNLEKSGQTAQIANLATRQEKSFDFSKEQLESKIADESGKIQTLTDTLSLVKETAFYEKEPVAAELSQTVSIQIENLSRNEIYNDVKTLIKEVLKENKNFSVSDVKKEIDSRTGFGLELDVRTIKTKDGFETKQFATYENIKSEQFVQNFIKEGKGKGFTVDNIDKSLKAFEKSAGFKLSDEQRAAINTINSTDRVSIVQGFAGTGKTTLFSAVNSAMKAGDVNVIGLSNTGAAALILQKETGIKSQTLKSLIVSNKQAMNVNNPTLFVLDETSQAGVKDIESVIKTIESAGYTNFKIAMSGDTKQIQSIAAGNVLKNAVATNVKQSILKDIRRQKNESLRSAVLNYYKELDKYDKGEKMDTRAVVNELQEKGFIKTVKSGEELKKAVEIYREFEKKGSVVMLVKTRAEMKAANETIRADKIKAGELGRTTFKLDTYEKQNMRETDRRRSENYEKGGIISTRNGEFSEITKVDHEKNAIEVKGLHNAVIGKNANLIGDNKIEIINKKDGTSKIYDIKERNGKLVTYYGVEKTIDLKTDKDMETLQKYSFKELELRAGDRVIFTQKVDGINPVKETIKYNKTDNSKLYETLKKFNINGFKATDFYKTIKGFNKVVDFVGVQVNNHRVDKAEAAALAKGENVNTWSFNGNKGITITHSQEIKNNMTGTFLGKSGDNYIFQLDNGEKLALNIKDDKGLQALQSLQLGYAITVPRAQGLTTDRAVSFGNARMSAEENLVAGTRAKHDFAAVVSDKDISREIDKETGKIQDSNLDRAFGNVTEKTTSITDERTPDKAQDTARESDRETGKIQDTEQNRDTEFERNTEQEFERS